MSDLPKPDRIWICFTGNGKSYWEEVWTKPPLSSLPEDQKGTEYLRADLAPAPVIFDDIHTTVAAIVDGEEMWSAYDVACAIHALLTKGRGGI